VPPPTYVTDCPNCGRELVHLVGVPEHAPWLCDFALGGCGRAWWPAELATDARLAWRPQYWDHAGHPIHGWGFVPEIHARCLNERDDARARGTSVLPEFVTRLTSAQLASLVLLLTPRAQLLDGAYALLQAARAALVSVGR
jgi:hypothetical protein